MTGSAAGGSTTDGSAAGGSAAGGLSIPARAAVVARTAAIVVAAGASRRMGGQNKILASLAGRPVLWHCLTALAAAGLSRIVLVVSDELRGEIALPQAGGWPPTWPPSWPTIGRAVTGGERRQDSVRAGLEAVDQADWILVHDGARPLVTPEVIGRGLEAAVRQGTAVAAVPVKDTIKAAGADGRVIRTLPRADLWAVQTPQIFPADLLRRAHQAVQEEVTDDASMVEAIGEPVHLYYGSYDNLKVTTPEDLVLAEAILRQRQAPRQAERAAGGKAGCG